MRECCQILTESRCNIVPSKENVKLIVYKGPSMNSTFQDMDVLYYVPNKNVRFGDVVVIKIPEYEHKIIHRVISVGKKGISTMGDGNLHPDSWLLSPDQIIGSVIYGYRGKRRFKVLGGLAGLAQMIQVRFKHLTMKTVRPIFSIIYHNLPISNVVILLIQPKPVAFKRSTGIELQLLVRGRVIGRRLPGQKWQIKVPFRFFLDESSLPD